MRGTRVRTTNAGQGRNGLVALVSTLLVLAALGWAQRAQSQGAANAIESVTAASSNGMLGGWNGREPGASSTTSVSSTRSPVSVVTSTRWRPVLVLVLVPSRPTPCTNSTPMRSRLACTTPVISVRTSPVRPSNRSSLRRASSASPMP